MVDIDNPDIQKMEVSQESSDDPSSTNSEGQSSSNTENIDNSETSNKQSDSNIKPIIESQKSNFEQTISNDNSKDTSKLNAQKEIQNQMMEEHPELFNQKKDHYKRNMIIIILLILLIAAIIIFFVYPYFINTIHTFNKTSNNINTSNEKYISSCGVINAKGTYILSGNLKQNAGYNSCLIIKSNNVTLIGYNKTIIGDNNSGSDTNNYTYGINVEFSKNVHIEYLKIDNFDFGIFLNNSSNALIKNVNLANNSKSGLYLINSEDDKVINSTLSASGPIIQYINNTSNFNNSINNTISNNLDCQSTAAGNICYKWIYINGTRTFVQVPNNSS
jgi:hypothetical protein